ncbi:hypothetical protein mRhiFer1_009606 [Rhinolophus ferrumequinum]|uniref:Uncharacterized protein n=1 Tax=Rhinolophus ferrumequinum TaxID=59479 RepID=A0A7J7ZQT7_RHIFE|nr:hypothetical protein mRhiFer1_009606 [Rhinolophus ferrumequinum]
MYSSGSRGDVLGPKEQAGTQISSAHSSSQAPKDLCNHSFNKTHDNKDWHPHWWQMALLRISALPRPNAWCSPEPQPQGCFWFPTSSLTDRPFPAKPPHPLLLSPSTDIDQGWNYHPFSARPVIKAAVYREGHGDRGELALEPRFQRAKESPPGFCEPPPLPEQLTLRPVEMTSQVSSSLQTLEQQLSGKE